MLLTQQWIPFVIWMNFLPMISFLFKPDLGLTAGEIQPWKRLHGWPPLLLEKGCFKGCADSAALWLLTICEQLLQGSCPVFNGLQRLLCVVAKVMGPYSRVSGILSKITTESHTLLHLDFLCFYASNTTVFVYRTYIECQWCWFYTDTDKLDLWIWWCHFREWVWWVILARRSSIFLCSGCLSEG